MRNGLTPEQDALAAELALGVLEGDDRAEAQRLCLADPAFAGAVDEWRMQLGILHETAADEPLPAAVWPAIEARLEVRPEPTDGSSQTTRVGVGVSAGPPASPTNVSTPVPGTRRRASTGDYRCWLAHDPL